MILFSKEKFASLTKKRQHKHAARILRMIIEEGAPAKLYSQIVSFFNLTELGSLEETTNRFHFHLKEAQISLSEDELLEIKKGDKSEGASFLDVEIYLDNLRSAHNVGSIIRITEAFRLGEIFFGGNTPNGLDTKIQKTSMGAHSHVTLHPNRTLSDLTKRPIIALETAKFATPINEFIFPESFSLILGNEELGVSEEGLKMADHIIEIPLYGKKNSINVAAAFAIVANRVRNG